MRLALHYRDVLSRWPALVEELDHLLATINALWQVEHRDDGTHARIAALEAESAEVTTLRVADAYLGEGHLPQVRNARVGDTGVGLYDNAVLGICGGRPTLSLRPPESGLPARVTVGEDGVGAVGGSGPQLIVSSSFAGTGAPAVLVLYTKSGSPRYLWVDATGVLRIHTAAPVEGGSDTLGTVVGAQT